MEWGRLTTITSIAQIGVQAIGFICGILIIRVLPTEEYALYTLANTMLGTMTILADGGILAGVMAEGGKVWQDKSKLGAVINTGIRLRNRFAIISLLITTPILIYLLHHHGASWITSILIILALIPAFYTALSGRILEIVPKLHQDIVGLQKIQIWSNLGRLGLLTLTIFVFPWAYIAIFAAGLPQIWANMQLRKQAKKFSDLQQRKAEAVQARIVALVKRMMPDAIYHVISGQLMIWLISIFGSTENLAQIGALARFAALLAVVQAVLGVLVVPHFAKIQANKKASIRLFLLVQFGLVCLTLMMSLFVWYFPQLILSILGPSYSDLSFELLLIIISACIALQSTTVYHISSSVGIVPPPIWLIAYMLSIQIGLLFIFDFSLLHQVILYSICVNAAILIYHTTYFLRVMR